MSKLTDEEKKAYHTLVLRRAMLDFAIRHPEKVNDKTSLELVNAIAHSVAEARIEYVESVRAAKTRKKAAP